MSKNILQNIVKIKNVAKEKEKKIEREKFEIETELRSEKENDNNSRFGLWFIALIAVVFLIFAVSLLFAGAKVTISPKTQDLNLNQNLTAIKDTEDGNLPFGLVAIEGEETKSIQGGEQKDVADKASGIVVVYNTFSKVAQTFSAGSRLEGSNGKIYKTDKKVIVPGMSTDGTPGSIEVSILGQEAGEEYNSAPLDFKIFGFKGTPKYTKFYARSKGDIVGGLKGKITQISDNDKTAALDELKNTLQTKLLKKITDQIPSGYILFKDAAFLETDGGTIGVTSADGMVPITLKGTFYGFLFEEKKLTQKIVEANIDKYDGSEVYIPNIRDLTFSLNDKENISFKNVTNISFTLTGQAKVVWKINEDKMKADLLGKKKKDFTQILSEYSNIDTADLAIKPVWKSSFPDKIDDIEVIVNYPK